MLENVSIRSKLLLSFGALLFINIVTGLVILLSANTSNKAVIAMQTANNTQNIVSEIKSTSTLMHQSLALYLNSGDLSQKQNFLDKQQSLPEMFKNADAVINDENIKKQLTGLQSIISNWEKDIATPQIEYMLSPYTVDMARLYETSEANLALWNNIGADFEKISQAIQGIVTIKSAELNSAMNLTMTATILGTLLIVITVMATLYFMVNTVSNPLKKLVEITNSLIERVWSVEILGTHRKDEVGQLAQALETFRENGIQNDKLVEQQKQEDEVRLSRAKNIERLVEQFRQDSDEVTQALENTTLEMRSTSDNMSAIAQDTSKLSSQVSETAQNAGLNVENVAAASEELTVSITEISKQLNKTNQMANEAKSITENTVEKMKVLEESANEIGNVIALITDIAEQTNLLALNATIESARAGEAGKGFAVVANEVKTLASQTATATEQVKGQIDKIQSDTKEAVEFIQKISKSIENLNEGITTIASAMEEQTAATQDISKNVTEASNGTTNVVQNIEQVSNATKKTQESSDSVNKVAEEISERSNKLKDSINVFIEDIKAA